MDEAFERQLRRQAIKQLLRGKPPAQVASASNRTRQWLRKWIKRFARRGWQGLQSQSRRPKRKARCFDKSIRRWVVRARQALEKAPVGLIGPEAVRQKLFEWRLRPLPSRRTVARILHEQGLSLGAGTPAKAKGALYPHLKPAAGFRAHALDWTCRYLAGGRKVFVFHTVDLLSHDLHHQIFENKTLQTACAHLLSAWQGPLGLPQALQLDNDIIFMGGHRVKRVISQLVRLCLAVDVEPVFLPFYEPKRNALVEEINGLWQWAQWRRKRFRSVSMAQKTQVSFRHWYRHHYHPPALNGLTPAQASRRQGPVVRLTPAQAHQLMSGPLPITAGRVHFIRLVDNHGEVHILNQTWKIGRAWAGHYVLATLNTKRQRLDVYHRPLAKRKVRRIKGWRYSLNEKTVPLSPQLQRHLRKRKMLTMSWH